MRSTRISCLIIVPRLISIESTYCKITKINIFFSDLEALQKCDIIERMWYKQKCDIWPNLYIIILLTLTNITQLRAVLGLFSYYQKFIKDFSHIAKPMILLLKKETPFNWITKQQTAFE